MGNILKYINKTMLGLYAVVTIMSSNGIAQSLNNKCKEIILDRDTEVCYTQEKDNIYIDNLRSYLRDKYGRIIFVEEYRDMNHDGKFENCEDEIMCEALYNQTVYHIITKDIQSTISNLAEERKDSTSHYENLEDVGKY